MESSDPFATGSHRSPPPGKNGDSGRRPRPGRNGGRPGVADRHAAWCAVIVLRPVGRFRPGRESQRTEACVRFRVDCPVGRVRGRAGLIVTTGANSRVQVQTAFSRQVADVVKLGRQLTVVKLLLHQAILDRAILLLELGDRSFQLLVLVFQMAQTRLELTNGRSTRQESSRVPNNPPSCSVPARPRPRQRTRRPFPASLTPRRTGSTVVRRVAGRKQIVPIVAFAMKCPRVAGLQ